VTWRENGFEGLYRWDFEGAHDLKVIGHPSKYTNPLTVSGSSVRISVTSESGSPSSLYGLKLVLNPVFSLATACKLPGFRADLERLRSEYSVGTMAHDVSLVSHLDEAAATKGRYYLFPYASFSLT